MPENFEPHSKALQIEKEAKTCLDQLSHSPIEASISQFVLNDQLNALTKNPNQFKQVGEELEKLGGDRLSTLPNVSISAKNGSIDSINFYSSYLDIGDNKTHVLEYKTATQQLNLVRIFY